MNGVLVKIYKFYSSSLTLHQQLNNIIVSTCVSLIKRVHCAFFCQNQVTLLINYTHGHIMC